MMEDWKKSICNQPSTISVSDITNYISKANLESSAIDGFYKGRDDILKSCTPQFAIDNPTVTPLMLVGLISLVENYYREIISELIKICPISKKNSSEKSINLASVWFGFNNLEKGALENISFSDSKNIEKNLKSFFGIQIDKSSNQVNAPLIEFAKLCELRHAIVHSASLLSGKNAVKLNLPNSPDEVQVVVSFAELQESAAICTSLICSSNLELFKTMSNRWLHEWPKTPAYIGVDLNIVFKQLWKVFYSKIDEGNGMIKVTLSSVKARNRIIKSKGA